MNEGTYVDKRVHALISQHSIQQQNNSKSRSGKGKRAEVQGQERNEQERVTKARETKRRGQADTMKSACGSIRASEIRIHA